MVDGRKKIDFRHITSLAYTKPTSLVYLGKEQYGISNWTQLYVQVLACLLESYPDKIAEMLNTNNRVVLYALYKFAEKCNLDKEFHVSYLFDESVERDGVSPVRIFGLYDEEELKSILLGLSAAYPDFINATFTNDLQTVTLRDKTSEDVLNLFREGL